MADSDHSSTPGKSPAFQFYPGDFLSDGKQAAMSLQECGAYIRLLCACWTEGSLPADVTRLSRLCGATVGQMRRMWPALSACFRPHDTIDGRVIHPRLERERGKQTQWREKSAAGGRRSQAKRNQQPTTLEPPLQPNGNQVVNQKPTLLSSSSSSDFSQHPHKEREGVTHPRAVTGSGVMGGSLPREHLRHVWCGRVCVPDFLHGQFQRATGQSDDGLFAFYTSTFTAIPDDEPVEPDALKFWRPRITANWPPATISSSLKPEDLLFDGSAHARR